MSPPALAFVTSPANQGRFMGKAIACWVGALLALMPAAPLAQSSANMQLVVTGAADTRFTGECVVAHETDEQVVPVEGVVPLQRPLTGRTVSCTIRQTTDHGRLEVELRKDGNISRAQVGGRGSTVTLEME